MDKVFRQWQIDILSKVDVPYFILNRMGAQKMIYAYEHDLNAIEKTEILRYQVLTNQKSYKKTKQLLWRDF